MKLVLSRVLGTTAFAAKISSPFLPLPQWIKFRLWYLQMTKLMTATSSLLHKTVLMKNIKMEVAKTKVHTGSSCAVRAEKAGPGLTSSQAPVRPQSHLPPPGAATCREGRHGGASLFHTHSTRQQSVSPVDTSGRPAPPCLPLSPSQVFVSLGCNENKLLAKGSYFCKPLTCSLFVFPMKDFNEEET